MWLSGDVHNKDRLMVENKIDFLNIGNSRFCGFPDKYVNYVLKHQIKDKALWKKFVNPFREYSDSADNGWRGEFFGKMMRGACIVYSYTKDKELYEILTDAIKDILSAQDGSGRISSYDIQSELNGWDVWCRKYVATALLHYIKICEDKDFIRLIISALKRHLDYIIKNVGSGIGQKQITQTSNAWGAVNSCTILEPFVELYKITKEKKYLDFAEYIIECGGSNSGNLVDVARENLLAPYQYPVTKTYEVMSFFEGVLAYYEATGKSEYLGIVKNFVEQLNNTEITVIGTAGCEGEMMNNAAKTQTEKTDETMQETCVTVTWLRLLARLYRNCLDSKYIDRFEKAALNAFYGSVNICNVKTYFESRNITVGPFPFDSYSPVFNGKRGRAVGGFKLLSDGTEYGCCASIGAAGVGLIPLVAVMQATDGIVFNEYFDGYVTDKCDNTFEISGGFPADFIVRILAKKVAESVKLHFRVPVWSDGFTITLNGKNITDKYSNGYFVYDGELKENDEFIIDLHGGLVSHELDGLVYYTYGPLVLARDNRKEGDYRSLYIKTDMGCNADEVQFKRKAAQNMETVRFEVIRPDGMKSVLTDYISCGKHWDDQGQRISVFWNINNY